MRPRLERLMKKPRTTYSADQKLSIVLSVLSRKCSIQKAAKDHNIAPTMISLWKKQAEDAMRERFQSRPKGRRPDADSPEKIRQWKEEVRNAKAKARALETSLREVQATMEEIQNQLADVVGSMGCQLGKLRRKHAVKAEP